MRWTDFSKLPRDERINILALKFRPTCDDALRLWNSNFPERAVSNAGFHEFINAVIEFFIMAVPATQQTAEAAETCKWARHPYVWNIAQGGEEEPQTKGEFLISGLAYFGPICWGWRSPANESEKVDEGEKSKGTLQRGVLGLVENQVRALDNLGVFLYHAELNGKTGMQAAKEFAKWSGDKTPLQSITRNIHNRIGRLTDPR